MPRSFVFFTLKSPLISPLLILLHCSLFVPAQNKTQPKTAHTFCSIAIEDSVIAFHFEEVNTKNDYELADTITLKRIQQIFYQYKAKRFLSYYFFATENTEKGYRYFKEYVADGGLLKNYLYGHDSLLVRFSDSLGAIYSDERKKYEASLDLDLRFFVKRLIATDQSVRKEYNETPKQLELERKDLMVKMTLIDSINQNKLDSLISYSGWPSRKLLGNHIFDPNPDIVVIHSDLSTKLKYYEIIKLAVLNNTEHPNKLIGILHQTFFRHQEEGYLKLRIVDFNNPAATCENEFVLKALSKFCQDNENAFHFYLTNNIEADKSKAIISAIKNQLVAYGMRPEHVQLLPTVSNTTILGGHDAYGSYDIVFKLVKLN